MFPTPIANAAIAIFENDDFLFGVWAGDFLFSGMILLLSLLGFFETEFLARSDVLADPGFGAGWDGIGHFLGLRQVLFLAVFLMADCVTKGGDGSPEAHVDFVTSRASGFVLHFFKGEEG